MSLPGSNATVVIEQLAQTKDSHGAKVDGAPVSSSPPTPAMVNRASLGNLWRILVAGNFGDIGKAPSEWRVTDDIGRTFACVKASYRAPIARLGESEHTLLFAELVGEIEDEARV